MSSRPLILHSREGDVVTLTFNDPDHLNAMTREMGEAFRGAIAPLANDDSLRAVVVTGAGRAFSAGGDFAMLESLAADGLAAPGEAHLKIQETMRSFYKLFLTVSSLPCPTIAAIAGHAIGAGLCVGLACDMRFVAREARLGLNFTKLGVHPGMAATWTVPRLVGPALAAELLYTSRLFGGEEAAQMGLANRALPADEVLAHAHSVAAQIAACAPLAVRGAKRSLARASGATMEDQLSFEAHEQALTFETRDGSEGIAAAKARRDPSFRGA